MQWLVSKSVAAGSEVCVQPAASSIFSVTWKSKRFCISGASELHEEIFHGRRRCLEGSERTNIWIKLGLTGGLGRGGRREGARPGHARCLDAVRGGLRAPVGGVPRGGATASRGEPCGVCFPDRCVVLSLVYVARIRLVFDGVMR